MLKFGDCDVNGGSDVHDGKRVHGDVGQDHSNGDHRAGVGDHHCPQCRFQKCKHILKFHCPKYIYMYSQTLYIKLGFSVKKHNKQTPRCDVQSVHSVLNPKTAVMNIM